jgi:hypothetical protein
MDTNRDRCPKNPSMLRAYCSHCQGTERGTLDNPRYSLKEGWFNGFPAVEVLKNGASIHMWDSHFRFGQRKAEILVACVSTIRKFGWATDGERLAFKSDVVEDKRRRLCVRISIEMHPEFEHSSGEIIDRPWLRLQTLPPDTEHIGIGMMKCRAIAALEDDLKRWLRAQELRSKHTQSAGCRCIHLKPALSSAHG